MTTAQKITSEAWKTKVWRYVHSSAVTFIAFFLLGLLIEMRMNTFEDIWSLGAMGIVGIIIRLLSKAVYETLLVKIPLLLKKLGVKEA